MSFLLDTDTCSAYLKGHQKTGNQFLLHSGTLHISAITVGELYTWSRRAKTLPKYAAAIEVLINDLPVIPVDDGIARRFGVERAILFDAGKPVAELDLMIAATALEYDLTLVTHNTSDYQRISGLRLRDWQG